MGCTPSMLLDHKKGHRDSTESQDQVLSGKGNKDGGSRGNNGRNNEPNVAKTAPRASMDSDGFSIQLGPTQAPNSASSTNNKKDSYVSQMGNNYTTSLHIKRISGGSGGSPSARLGHRKSSLALTPEDEPLDITNRNTPGGMTGGIVVPHVENLRVMTVMFPERGDRVSDAIAEACSRLGLDSNNARSDEAPEMCTNYRPALVLVDCRTNRLDGENVCRALRNLKFTQFTVIVAVVKKSHYVKEDFSILPFLDAGFNRVIVESTHASAWFRELSQLTRGLARPLAQAGAARALLAALQRVKDAVHITDEHCRIQYANRAGERLCGSGVLEVGADALSQLGRGREWEGALPGRRRIGGGAEMPSPTCHAVPVSCDGRSTTHFVFVSEFAPPLFPTPAWETARGSMHSVRRASLDVRSIGSEGMRRASLAKLQGLPLEAPITKVIALLSSAQEGATPQTVMLIDKAVDVLRNTELYSPHLRTDDHRLRPDDPVANDLIGALLSQGPTNVLSSRRSSNDSTVIRSQASRQNTKHYAPVQIRDLLDTSLSWDFDIFRLEDLTKRRPLVHLGINLMIHFDACSVLDCDEKTVLNWLTIIEMNYHASNTYHNSTHAADVMQAVACYLQRDRLQSLLEPLDEVCALIAAAAHDVDHPGTSSAFLCNSRHPLAVLYNDLAVLESHHAALMFKLTINDDRVNIFKNLDRESYKTARHTVIDMILATEMTRHFEHLAKFVNVFCSKPNSGSKEDGMTLDDVPVIDVSTLSLPENIVLIKRMMIKCADVSNPSRSAKFCIEWARRIAEEYFLQTDEEKARDLPVVMPVFDRASCSIPRSQIGFIDFIIIDMMEAWDAFIDMPDIVQHTRANYKIWRDMDEQGVTTLQDVKKMQATLVTPVIPKSRLHDIRKILKVFRCFTSKSLRELGMCRNTRQRSGRRALQFVFNTISIPDVARRSSYITGLLNSNKITRESGEEVGSQDKKDDLTKEDQLPLETKHEGQ